MLVHAKMRGVPPLEALYDYLAEGDGANLIYLWPGSPCSATL